MLEKILARHLTTVLSKYSIADSFQSCFPKAYSTETLLVRVSSENDGEWNDARDCSVLDLTSALDTADHHF